MALITRYLLRYFEPFSALIAVTLGAALVLGHLLVRPHLLALPLLVIWSGELFAARNTGSAPPAWLLPLMALWANLHGSFMFGLALALCLGAEAALLSGRRMPEARRWGLFGLLAVAASLMTPNGVAGFVEPFRLTMMPALQASFGEWMSPNFQSFQPLEIWLLGMIALGFTTGIRLPLHRLLLLLACVIWRWRICGTPSFSGLSAHWPWPPRSARRLPPGSGRLRCRRSAGPLRGWQRRPTYRRWRWPWSSPPRRASRFCCGPSNGVTIL
jgi:hypothetical protein